MEILKKIVRGIIFIPILYVVLAPMTVGFYVMDTGTHSAAAEILVGLGALAINMVWLWFLVTIDKHRRFGREWF